MFRFNEQSLLASPLRRNTNRRESEMMGGEGE